jgi:hypothetical protein
MRKDDVEFHRLGYGYDSVPAVNVKVSWPQGQKRRELLEEVERETGETGFAGWAEEAQYGGELADEWPDWAFGAACEDAWGMLQTDAEEIFGAGTKVYAEGRSGGWAYIDGMTAEDVEGWDAIALGRWAKFARWARQQADNVPYQEAWIVAVNVYGPAHPMQGPTLEAIL